MANRYLIDRYNSCTENEKRQGELWYESANKFCESTALLYGINLEIVAAVVSALSPRNRWERNTQDALSLIQAKDEGSAFDSFSVCTFTGNKTKAWNLLDNQDSFDPDVFFKGPKTRCFWDNITYRDSQRVTIDTWAIRAAYNTRANWQRSITLKEYRKLEKTYLTAAAMVGAVPKVFQAVVWVSVRNELLFKKNEQKQTDNQPTLVA